MTLALTGHLSRSFRDSSDAAAYRESLLRHQREQERKRDDVEIRDRTDDAGAEFAVAMVAVSEIADFRLQIDIYDADNIAALQRNEIELREAEKRVEEIFAKAHVLPDGRRVFKDDQGIRVFDEFGTELSVTEIDPDEIEDWRPRWSVAKDAIDWRDALSEEREERLLYQEKLDQARDRLDAGNITRDEFTRLQADLAGDMPQPAQRPEAQTASQTLATDKLDLDFTDDMVPTFGAPAGPGLRS